MNTFLKTLTAVAIPIAILILSSATAPAQETKASKKAEEHSPAGSWTWERKSGKSKIESNVTIVEKDGKFSGKFKDDDHDLDIKNCKLEDGTFSFAVFPDPKKPEHVIKFSGKVSADKIKGKMNYMVKDEAKSVTWTATRYIPMDAVIGKWQLEFETPDGVALEFMIQAKKKGKGLGVSFVDDDATKVRKVKFKNGVLSFDSQQVYEEQPVSVEWDLKIDGDEIIGTLYYMFDEQDEEGEIEVYGERVK